jgi:methenyltetrahydrofolate cyclohydrolase
LSARVASLLDSPGRDLLDQLAAKQPTPGGGSVAALTGALGAGLVSMVGQYTAGREQYADVEQHVQRILARSEELRARLGELVDADVAAYGSYAAAQAMPRESDDEKQARKAAQQRALEESTAVPLDVAEACVELLELAVEAAQVGNVYLISDAAVGARLADAARASAMLNVEMNLGGIEDEAKAAAFRDRAAAVLDDSSAAALAEKATATVRERSGG